MAQLGRACGVKPENIFISDIGRVLEIGPKGAGFHGTVPSGRVLVDGNGVGDVGAAVLRERKALSESGMITVAVGVDFRNRTIVTGPEIISRGFIFVREAEELMGELRELARETLENALNRSITYCYAVEGAYPQSLDYLKTNYGITYNEDLFFVDYRISGANIFPDVTIIERSGTHASTETSETHH